MTVFQGSNAEAFFAGMIGTSTQDSATTHIAQDWYYRAWESSNKTFQHTVRAIRRIAVLP